MRPKGTALGLNQNQEMEPAPACQSPVWVAMEELNRQVANLEKEMGQLPERLRTLIVPRPATPTNRVEQTDVGEVLAPLPQEIQGVAGRVGRLRAELNELMSNMQL